MSANNSAPKSAEKAIEQYHELIRAGAIPDKVVALLRNELLESERATFDAGIREPQKGAVSESRHPDGRRNWKVVNARRATGRLASQVQVSRYQIEQVRRLRGLCTSQEQYDEFHRRVMSGELKPTSAIKEAETALLLQVSNERRSNYCDRRASRMIRSLWKCMLKAVSEIGTIPSEDAPAIVIQMLLSQKECQNPDTASLFKAIVEQEEADRGR
jgi:hypothetical protein